MNPLSYKAHPLLARWVDLITEPSAHHANDLLALLVILFATNLLWASALPWLLGKIEGLTLSPLKAYYMALPATFLYAPLMLTLLRDIIGHAFEWRHRWLLILMLIVASQLLTAFYAFGLRHPRSGVAIGLESGLGVALFLLLASIPASLIMIGADKLKPFF
jgi:hypothetical protein